MGKIFKFKRKQYSSLNTYKGRGKPYPINKNGKELPRPRWKYDETLPVIVNIHYSKTYESDMTKLVLSEDKRRVKQLIKSLIRGNIFDNDPNDPTEYTHWLEGTKYIYSKDINGRDRMTYWVKQPEKIYNLIVDTWEIIFKISIGHVLGHQGNFKGISKTYSNNE